MKEEILKYVNYESLKEMDTRREKFVYLIENYCYYNVADDYNGGFRDHSGRYISYNSLRNEVDYILDEMEEDEENE